MILPNSNCDEADRCESGSPRGRRLRDDLAASTSRCTVAYWHRPPYSTGVNVAGPQVRPLWDMLHDRRADVILSGHAHRYERHAPMTQEGARSVVGTGGAGGGISYADATNVQRVKTGMVGVLRLGLRANSHAWEFVPVAGRASRTGAPPAATEPSCQAVHPTRELRSAPLVQGRRTWGVPLG